MQTNREKAVLIIEINAAQTTPAIISILKLLDILIREARIRNDAASPNEVLVNQGGIRAMVDLKEHIQRGLPGSSGS